MANSKGKKESTLDIIARNVAELTKGMSTISSDIKDIKQNMATKDDIRDLENKLIEDTGAITGTEQKHNRSLTQRVSRLEKEVFHV